MNNQEAKKILAEKLAEYRKLTYEQLVRKIGQECEHFDIQSSSGVTYQVDISVVWDDKQGEDVRVLGSVDDGGWRAFAPLGDDFILAPDGTFVGEET